MNAFETKQHKMCERKKMGLIERKRKKKEREMPIVVRARKVGCKWNKQTKKALPCCCACQSRGRGRVLPPPSDQESQLCETKGNGSELMSLVRTVSLFLFVRSYRVRLLCFSLLNFSLRRSRYLS